MKRGEIWLVDLGEPRGSAPALVRPAILVSDDRFNASQIGTVTVCAITRTSRLAAVPGNVAIPAGIAGLSHDSVANVTQLATVDKMSLQEKAGALPAWLGAKLDEGLTLALGLSG